MPSSLLFGLRVLVLEDDPIIALDVAQTLADAGATILGPAYRVAQALDLIERSAIDVAVLDFRLETATASPVAHRLSARGIPYLFHTSSRGGSGTGSSGVPIIDKPTHPERLVAAIKALTKSQ